MSPIETLKEEHQVILMVVENAERVGNDIRKGRGVDWTEVEVIVDFFRNFVERFHHRKEEKCLFKRLEDRGVADDSGPISTMLTEHEATKNLVDALIDVLPEACLGDLKALEEVEENLSGFAELIREHIAKEETILFPLAEKLLVLEDWRALAAAFQGVELDVMGPALREKYHSLMYE
jgi:hemerythrin-like domain-containing protein